MVTGYSKKSLREKLGIKEYSKIAIVNPPEKYTSTLKLQQNILLTKELEEPLDFIHFFTRQRKELDCKFPILKQALSRNGTLDFLAKKVIESRDRFE